MALQLFSCDASRVLVCDELLYGRLRGNIREFCASRDPVDGMDVVRRNELVELASTIESHCVHHFGGTFGLQDVLEDRNVPSSDSAVRHPRGLAYAHTRRSSDAVGLQPSKL